GNSSLRRSAAAPMVTDMRWTGQPGPGPGSGTAPPGGIRICGGRGVYGAQRVSGAGGGVGGAELLVVVEPVPVFDREAVALSHRRARGCPPEPDRVPDPESCQGRLVVVWAVDIHRA